MESSKRLQHWSFGVSCVFALAYVVNAIRGIKAMADPATSSQGLLTLLTSLGGIVLSFLPYLTRSILKLEISFPIFLLLEIVGALGILLGEGMGFYYRFSWWDDLLHFFSGFWVSFLAVCFLTAWKADDQLRHPILFVMVGACVISFASSFLWEIYEFTMDSLCGTNMQKVLPDGVLFNNGNTLTDLTATDEEIAAFYRTSGGYRFALLDTMSDMCEAAVGSLIFLGVVSPILSHHPHLFDGQVRFLGKRKAEGANLPLQN